MGLVAVGLVRDETTLYLIGQIVSDGLAMTQSDHALHFNAGTNPAKLPLVLLHGSGGDEYDLVPLAEDWLRDHHCSLFAEPSPLMAGLHFSLGCLTGRLRHQRTDADTGGFHSGHHGRPKHRQAAYRHRLRRWCHHGGGTAAFLAGAILFRPLSPFSDDPTPKRLLAHVSVLKPSEI
jgi:hypothetical protein